MIPGLLSWDQPQGRQKAGSGGGEREGSPRRGSPEKVRGVRGMGGPDAPHLPKTDSRALPVRCAHLGLSQRSQERGAGCARQTRGAEQTGHQRQPLRRGLSSARTQRPSQTEPGRRFYFCFQPLFGIPGSQSATSPPSRITGHLGRRNTSSLASPAPGLQMNRLTLTEGGAQTPSHLPLAERHLRPHLLLGLGEEPHPPRETACHPRTLVSRCKGTCSLPALPTRVDLAPHSHNSPAVNSPRVLNSPHRQA